jgi:hypothetical protein
VPLWVLTSYHQKVDSVLSNSTRYKHRSGKCGGQHSIFGVVENDTQLRNCTANNAKIAFKLTQFGQTATGEDLKVLGLSKYVSFNVDQFVSSGLLHSTFYSPAYAWAYANLNGFFLFEK